MKFGPFLLHACQYGSPRQIYSLRVITLFLGVGGLNASAMGGRYGVSKRAKKAYLQTYEMYGQVGNAKEMAYGAPAAQLKTLR